MPLGYLYSTRGERMRKFLLVAYLTCTVIVGVALGSSIEVHSAFYQMSATQRQAIENQQRIDAISERVAILEQDHLDRRLTRMETVQETNHTLLLGVATAIFLLLLEAVLRLISVGRNLRKQEQRG